MKLPASNSLHPGLATLGVPGPRNSFQSVVKAALGMRKSVGAESGQIPLRLPRKSDFSVEGDSPAQSRRASTDKKALAFLASEKEADLPRLSAYQPNAQEREAFGRLGQAFAGQATDQARSLTYAEAEREKELLDRLQALRRSNGDKRKRIEELTSQLVRATETVHNKRANLVAVQTDFDRTQDATLKLAKREQDLAAELDALKAMNDQIMAEMQDMKNKINAQIEKLDATDKIVKKKELEYQIEKEATDHLKEILKKSLSGKQPFRELEDEKLRQTANLKQTAVAEEKITLDKFIAIMTAIKNEKEVLFNFGKQA